jgi:ribosomal protein L37E
MMMKMKNDIKLANEKSLYSKKCRFCGHTMTFYAFETTKKLCSWCGRYNYKDGKSEFIDKLKKERNKK